MGIFGELRRKKLLEDGRERLPGSLLLSSLRPNIVRVKQWRKWDEQVDRQQTAAGE